MFHYPQSILYWFSLLPSNDNSCYLQFVLIHVHVTEELGDREKSTDITCITPDRQTTSDVSWLRDGALLDTGNSDKYELSSSKNRLTVKDIVGTDEGNYSCMYEDTNGEEQTSYAGCLIVFGELRNM